VSAVAWLRKGRGTSRQCLLLLLQLSEMAESVNCNFVGWWTEGASNAADGPSRSLTEDFGDLSESETAEMLAAELNTHPELLSLVQVERDLPDIVSRVLESLLSKSWRKRDRKVEDRVKLGVGRYGKIFVEKLA
jgi:hypothetical protein